MIATTNADQALNATFAALADPTRRAILARLASGDASVMELAEPFAMSQPAISKHLKVLERAGLISRGRDAQRRPRRLEAKPLADANDWLERYRQYWEDSYQNLDILLAELKTTHTRKRKPTKPRGRKPMTKTGELQITTRGEREIMWTRDFDAPRTLVFDALTKPELIKRWLGVRGGWSLAVCEVDLRVGGSYRYVWRGPKGEMGMGGVFREIVPLERIVTTEVFDDPWYPGGAVGTAVLVEHGGKTTLTHTVLYASREARDGVLKSPMETGLVESYNALEALLASTPAEGVA